MRRFLAFFLALGLGISGASAEPVFRHGGHQNSGGGGGGTAFACDAGGSGVCADHSAGQTFVQWPDALSAGVTDYTKRYRVVRSASPITSGNYGSATVIGNYDLPNSGQLLGGNPDNVGGSAFTQANRQANNAANPMSKIPDANAGGLKTLAYATGLQVYKALANESAYYAVIQTNTSDTGDVYLGSVGPIAETAATPQAIQYAHRTSGSRFITNDGGGNPVGTAGRPLIFSAHASNGSGAATSSTLGDYYEYFGDLTTGHQDGDPKVFDVSLDGVGGTSYPSLTGNTALILGNRDSVWTPDGTTYLETFHFGIGLSPNPLVGAANRFYPITANTIQKELNWTIAKYGADPNKLHWFGQSMGAIAGPLTGLHMTSPSFASMWLNFPLWRYDLAGANWWCGNNWPSAAMAFKPSIASGINACGTNVAAILRSDGSSFQNYVNSVSFLTASPGTDLPFVGWNISHDDVNLASSGAASFQQQIDAVNAFQTAHRGHAFCWNMGAHDMLANAAIDFDAPGADAAAYKKSFFTLTTPYIATDHSSIDDNLGTATRNASGIMDGDSVGCVNAGFAWNVTSDTAGGVNFTIGNAWLGRSPTLSPQTTLTSSMLSSGNAAFTVTDSTVFQTTGGGAKNIYFLIGGTEIISATTFGAGSVTPAGRGKLGTTAQAHSSGETIQQYISAPTGPNAGPFSTMTANLTPRRLQGFLPANGTTPTCTITPFGGSPTTQTPTVANGLFTLTGVTINSGGNTSVSCI